MSVPQTDWKILARRAWPNLVIREGNGPFAAIFHSDVFLYLTQLERRMLAPRGAKWFQLQQTETVSRPPKTGLADRIERE